MRPAPPPKAAATQGAGRQTLNFVLSQLVVSSAVADEDFRWQLAQCPASVAIVIMDATKTSDPETLRKAKNRAQRQANHLEEAGLGLSHSAAEADELLDAMDQAPSSPRARRAMVKRSKTDAYKLKKK